MALLPPRVIGPLSECSTGVRVQGQLTNSAVEVFVSGALVAQGIASGPDQIYPLNAGASLSGGDQVAATQTIGLDTSIPSPDAVEVQSKPPTIGPVAFVSHLDQCGHCLWLEGLVPGADVAVRASGGPVLGNGQSYDGIARVGLTPSLAAGMVVEAQQNACGSLGAVTTGPPMDVIVEKQRSLPTPTVESPLRECQRTVTVSDVVHGVSRSGHRVTEMRRRRSMSCSSGTEMWKGRPVLTSPAAESVPGRRLTVLAAAAVARKSRRVGDVADITFPFFGPVPLEREAADAPSAAIGSISGVT